jgi:hypothetical protein
MKQHELWMLALHMHEMLAPYGLEVTVLVNGVKYRYIPINDEEFQFFRDDGQDSPTNYLVRDLVDNGEPVNLGV